MTSKQLNVKTKQVTSSSTALEYTEALGAGEAYNYVIISPSSGTAYIAIQEDAPNTGDITFALSSTDDPLCIPSGIVNKIWFANAAAGALRLNIIYA